MVPPGPLLKELSHLAALYRSSDAFERAVAYRKGSIEHAGLPIRLTTETLSSAGAPSTNAGARGQRVPELYFHQIFSDGSTLLDLRLASFSEEGGALSWNPSGALAEWSPEFRRALRGLYRGFYLGDDIVFREGLAALGLAKAEDAIRSQFGEGQQRAVRFLLKDFQQKFQDVFVRCQETGSRIDTGFCLSASTWRRSMNISTRWASPSTRARRSTLSMAVAEPATTATEGLSCP